MDQDTRIAKLEAEVAALHLFVIAIVNSVDGGVTSQEFDSEFSILHRDLREAGLPGSAERLDAAYTAICHKSTGHLVR
jgi:hypothetical protein